MGRHGARRVGWLILEGVLDGERGGRFGNAGFRSACFRNAVRGTRETCGRCAIPAYRYEYCLACEKFAKRSDLADLVAMLTYAVAGEPSGEVLKGYKSDEPEHHAIVSELVRLALSLHARCPGALARAEVSHWAAVPSLPRKPGEHALHDIVRDVAPGREVRLLAAEKVRRPRAVSADHFAAESPVPAGAHVLLLDDTWTTGGHAQSAALALKKAGAGRVSLLVAARWIKPDFGDNGWFLGRLRRQAYDPAICPWTGGACPDGALAPEAQAG
jgi:predicted amidophosphoribosyltransferase